MSQNIRVKGNVNIKVGGTTRWYAKEGVEINSNGRIDYFAPSHSYGEPESPPVKEGIKEIELLTALDFGSTNDKSDKLDNEGMIFGKTYHFSVKNYIKDAPKNKSDIKWLLKYHSLSENKWKEILLESKGDNIKITMLEEDLCGRFIYVRAYIKDPEKEGELKVWKHNRFRWFNRMKIHEQIKSRVNDPWKINQGGSSLCGMAALYYAMIKRDPKAYEKLAKDVFRTGKHIIGDYILKPHDKTLSMYEVNPTDRNYISMGMPAIDWIVLATTRSKESLNSQFVYNGFENGDMDMLKAVNWPDMLTRMCKEVAGFSTAESVDLGLLQIANKKGMSGKLNDAIGDMDILNLKIIDRKYKKGHTILMMIDSSMIEDETGYNVRDLTTDSHWVVYEGGLKFLEVGDIKFVHFNIYTWGLDFNHDYLPESGDKKEVNLKYKLLHSPYNIEVNSFKSNYYGYIELC